jgi:hypothetical protein
MSEPIEHILCRRGDLRPGRLVGGIIGANAHAGLGLDNHLMAMGNIFAHGTRRQADAVLMVLDFLGATDAH